MTGRTRRKIKRFFGTPFGIVSGIFTIVSVIAAGVLQSLAVNLIASLLRSSVNSYVPLIIFWLIIILVILFLNFLLLYIYSKALAPEINYFKEKNFGKPEENTILKAIDGILDAKKVEPFYVHAAPKSKEVENVYLRLKETGFAMVSGGPGEGKSMVAYHAAYGFRKNRYRVYALGVEQLENKIGNGIINEVLSQLDNLKGKRKLIIVDDAHKLALAIKQHLNIILQQEAKEEHGKYIWVETEFYGEKQAEIQPDMYIRVDFQGFFENLLKNFYRSRDPILKKALEGRIEGLKDAMKGVNRGSIRDAWHFAFVASRGEERLEKESKKLEDPEMLVLFFISAYTILSGESELPCNYLLNKLGNLRYGWLTEALRRSSFSDIIRSLQEQTRVRKSMIKIYDKSKSDRWYIASLHYNFARAVIRTSLLRTHLVEELLSSVKELLTSEYHKCTYIGIFRHDIGSYASGFDRKNKDWLINFVNNPLSEKLQCYSRLLSDIESVAEDIYDEIIRKLDIIGIAEKVNDTEVEQFQALAYLLNVLGDRRDELIEKLDLIQLSKKISDAEVGQFEQIAHLLNVLGDRRDEFIEKFDFVQLGTETNNATIGQFAQIENLIIALGDNKNRLIEKINLKNLVKQANNAKAWEFENLAHLLRGLGDYRDELIGMLDFVQLAETAGSAEVGQFQQLAYLLNTLGGRRDALIEKLNLTELAKKVSSAKIEQFSQIEALTAALCNNVKELIEKLDLSQLSKTIVGAEIEPFYQMSQLLNVLGDGRDNLLEKLNYNILMEKAKSVDPADISTVRGLTLFVAQLDEERRNKFVKKVQWVSICKRCPINTNYLPTLGASLQNLVKQAEILSDSTNVDDVAKHLRAHMSEIKQCIIKADFHQYRGLAKFLWNCKQVNHQLAIEICDADTIAKLIKDFSVYPCNYRGVGELINALYSINPQLSESFINNRKVKGTIEQSINMRDWGKEEEENLKHLIKAFYKSAPDLWREMVNLGWIVVDLSSFDLNAIYRDIDGKKSAGNNSNFPIL